MSQELFQQFSQYEDELIRRFRQHTFFKKFSGMTDEQLKSYLTKRWFLSENFVRWYDKAINGLSNEDAKNVLRGIILDETPSDKPSHREDLLADLNFIGVKRENVLSSKPSKETIDTVDRLYNLAGYTEDPYHDLRVMCALRMAGEILVAEEYRYVVPELERRFGLTDEKSRFFAPHFYHDRKDKQQEKEGSHTDSFVNLLEKMISDEQALYVSMDAAKRGYEARARFYDQFTVGYKFLRTARNALVTAASIAAVVYLFLAPNGKQTPQEEYARFLASLPRSERAFYLDCDRWLIDQYDRTLDTKYLKNVGTLQAVKDVWGEGP
ncbi:MAG: iron-containing redox enzyme family protein [Candidatus Aenigmarchaeota archaeon]|nr:iron-containing redox enzyme family protein [Candidatus Aenigmarchaeota archaeon]